jgi:hypothetical protein
MKRCLLEDAAWIRHVTRSVINVSDYGHVTRPRSGRPSDPYPEESHVVALLYSESAIADLTGRRIGPSCPTRDVMTVYPQCSVGWTYRFKMPR